MATTSILAHGVPSSRGGFSLGGAWTLARAMLQARQGRRLLAEMDPRLLADIGTSRADAQMEAGRPFWDIGAR